MIAQPRVLLTALRLVDYQQQYPPSSVATDITLSQFLSIQEKGVSAWCFEPDYESNLSLYVESRTEITFLSDGPGMAMREGGGNTVLANLPLPKLNEVYYWEAKMYEKPASTEVVVGLATKPFPSFRLPGWAKVSVGYFSSDGFKCHNYPFTASSHGPPLAEGDVLGVGYRPRTGTVFFTRNGRKLDDCYRGLQNFNLFPAIGANGPATVHVNLGQAGFVFIEANVKKWGLAPMMGTLAPPPAYGSERGSILLDAGYGTPNARSNIERSMDPALLVAAARQMAAGGDLRVDHRLLSSSQGSHGSNRLSGPSSFPSQLAQSQFGGSAAQPRSGNTHRRTQSHRDRRPPPISSAAQPSPLRVGSPSNGGDAGPSRVHRRNRRASRLSQDPARYHSPTDQPDLQRRFPQIDGGEDAYSDGSDSASEVSNGAQGHYSVGSSPESSPLLHNPPTPNGIDISLRSLHQHSRSASYFGGRAEARDEGEAAAGSGSSDATLRPGAVQAQNGVTTRNAQGWPASAHNRVVAGVAAGDQPPPGYSPLDPHVYQGEQAELRGNSHNGLISSTHRWRTHRLACRGHLSSFRGCRARRVSSS